MKRFALATGLAGILLVPVVFVGGTSQALELPVPLPGPVETIIKEVPVPGPVKTVIKEVPVPGPTETVFVDRPVPGPTRTIIIRESQEPGSSPIGQSPPPRATLSSETPVPQLAPTPPAPQEQGRVPGEDKELEVTVPEAIGISVGLVLLGIALGLLALYLVYGVGFMDAKRKEEKKLSELTDELFGR